MQKGKILIALGLLCSSLTSIIPVANAQRISPVRVDPRTYILNAGNDLGKVQVKGTYYVPTPGFEYTNVDGVKQQMLNGLGYDNSFYASRHITPDVVNGTDDYKVIEWENPLVLKNLSSVKQKLKGFLFAYRVNGNVKWMDGADVNSAFFSGYGSSSNQTVILYPIKEKAGPNKGKLLGFMEYPCGNLVCRDASCSDLKPKYTCGDGILNPGEACDPKDPNTKEGCTSTCQYKELKCEVNVPSGKFDHTKDITGLSVNAQSPLKVTSVTVDGKTYDNGSWSNIGKLPSGNHTVTAQALNPYTNRTVECSPGTISINQKIWCGDGIKNGGEQCDYNDPAMKDNGLCSKSCKLNAVKCEVTVNPKVFSQGDKLTKDNFTIKTTGEVLDAVLHNKKAKTQGEFYNNELTQCGTHKATFYVRNPFSTDNKHYSCSTTFKVNPKEFCGDGIVQKNEQCDPADSTTGIACNSSCELSLPACEITDTLSKYYIGKTSVFGISPASNSKIVSVGTSDGLKGGVVSGTTNGAIKFTKPGNYEIVVGVKNIYDKGKNATSFCKKNVVVENLPKCELVK